MSSSTNAPVVAQPAASRLAYIDALRGLAALYVVLYHLVLLPNPHLVVPSWISPFIAAGGTGVTLFFVVSAFTLCASMNSRKGDSVRNFYLRRFFRIAPLFYFWIALAWVRDWRWFHVHQPWWKVLLSASFTYNFIPGQEQGFVWASWTLGVEMIFYLLFPLLYRGVTDYRRALGFFLATIVVATLYGYWVGLMPLPTDIRGSFLHFSFLHMLPIFSCGILTYHLYTTFFEDRPVNRNWGWVLLGGAGFGYAALLSNQLSFLLDSLYWQAIIYSTLLLGLSIIPWRPVVNRFTVFLGMISYSLYLNHPTLVAALTPLYNRIYAHLLPKTVQFGLCVAVTLSCLIAASYMTYHLIEGPGQRFASNLIRRLNASKSSSTTEAN